MNNHILSDSEMEILNWMWENDKEYSYREIFNHFVNEENKDWKKQTLSTFLARMEKKEVLISTKSNNKLSYKAALDRKQYAQRKARLLLETYFSGSLNQFMVALNGGVQINYEEAKDLRKLLEEE